MVVSCIMSPTLRGDFVEHTWAWEDNGVGRGCDLEQRGGGGGGRLDSLMPCRASERPGRDIVRRLSHVSFVKNTDSFPFQVEF